MENPGRSRMRSRTINRLPGNSGSEINRTSNREQTTVISDIEHTLFIQDEKLRQLPENSQKRWIIYPDDSLKVSWDFIMLLLIIYSITFVPYKVAFWESETDFSAGVDLTIDTLFFIDIIVTFFSAYIDSEGQLIINSKIIVVSYLKTWFLTDLVACVPLQLFLDSSDATQVASVSRVRKLSRIVRIVKIFRLLKFWNSKSKIIDFIMRLSAVAFGAERLLCFFCSFIVFCHLLACLWFGFLSFTSLDSNNWVMAYGMDLTDDDSELYLASLYFVITTLSTVGFGDIKPVNDSERILCIFIMVVGVFFYSYTIGSITAIMTRSQRKEFKLQEQIRVMRELSKKFKLKKSLYRKIKGALQYQDAKNSNREVLLGSLPYKLSVQLSCLIHRDLLENNEFFSNKPNGFIYKVVEDLKPLKLRMNEILYKKGRPCDECKFYLVYFLVSGSIAFYEEDKIYHTITEGQYFGDVELFLYEERETNTKALRTSELLSLGKNDLFYALRLYEDTKILMIVKADRRRRELLEARQAVLSSREYYDIDPERGPGSFRSSDVVNESKSSAVLT